MRNVLGLVLLVLRQLGRVPSRGLRQLPLPAPVDLALAHYGVGLGVPTVELREVPSSAPEPCNPQRLAPAGQSLECPTAPTGSTGRHQRLPNMRDFLPFPIVQVHGQIQLVSAVDQYGRRIKLLEIFARFLVGRLQEHHALVRGLHVEEVGDGLLVEAGEGGVFLGMSCCIQQILFADGDPSKSLTPSGLLSSRTLQPSATCSCRTVSRVSYRTNR